MHEPNEATSDRPLRFGSLFSGSARLDLTVKQVFRARTVWLSEINEPVAHVLAHHWPTPRTSTAHRHGRGEGSSAHV